MTVPLIEELRSQVTGEVYSDRVSRALYATDASPYQIDPVAVVVPRTNDDVRAVLATARLHGVPVLPRGAATSLAGQTVGAAIQIDFSKYLNQILELNVHEGWVRVQPGIVLNHLNGELAPHGLKFAPDVSPSNRATIGGMIGNNSSGAYSLRYGKTIDHVLELRVLLSDGSEAILRERNADELANMTSQASLEGQCCRVIRELARQHETEIEQRYPKIMRRVGGYNLDAFKPGQPFNLANMIVGSEGTLALILEAKLRLVPRPAATSVALLEFADLFDALDATSSCLECNPVAVELMDDLLIGLTRKSLQYKHYLDILKTDAAALLMVEFHSNTDAEVAEQLDHLEAHLAGRARVTALTRAITAAEKAPVWLVRKAGLPLLQSMSPRMKPETCVEDTAVPTEHLSSYTRRFKALIEQHGTVAAFYGHASVGLLHVRPLLNLQDPNDVVKMRSLSEGVRELVLEYGGAVSGEHGDGLMRSEHNQRVFGSELYAAFQTIKHTFDPQDILNPGKIVDAPPLDEHLRYVPPRGQPITLDTHFMFRDTGGMLGGAELCNGNGECRKTESGTMCPSYMVTRDEEHSTRGRANALRLALGGVLPTTELWGERMGDVLDLCIECKGCTAECPSGVNMTRLKSEWLAQRYARFGTPLRAQLFGHIRTINRIGSAVAPVSNMAMQLPGVGLLNELALGISRHRKLPRFASQTFTGWFNKGRHTGSSTSNTRHGTRNTQKPTVVLFPDTFTNYNDPQIGIAATQLLEALGYNVILPTRPICCGRPLISKGLLGEAKSLAQQQLEWLAPYAQHGIPIIGLEPSCLLTFRDEYGDLLDDPRTQALKRHALLLDEFLGQELERGNLEPQQFNPHHVERQPALVHGHCHQKALASVKPTLTLLDAAGFNSHELDSGCCGMAGSFGYEREHHAISLKIGERVLLPAIRAASTNTTVVAMGTSCRQQIGDGTDRRAQHIAEVLWQQIALGQYNGNTE